jgi:aryl-alcohol dehydrogenase-like predicted oxidoreductase
VPSRNKSRYTSGTMEQRFVGTTGLSVSKLAFGTMSFGGDANEAEAARLYARCREAGINLFDCADVYSKGRAEQILGGFIRAHRNEVVLATKAGFPMSGDPNARGASRYHLVRACEASLRRLQTDRIDVYYVHRFDPQTQLEETLIGLELLVKQGKILYPAVSNFAAWQTQRALDYADRTGFAKLACIQPMYNLLKRQAEVELLPMAQHNGLGVFPYSPLAGGLLSGKYARGGAGSAARLVTNKAYQTRYAHTQSEQVVPHFMALAAELGVHPTTLAVAWVAAHPAVTAPLLGARSVEQLEPSLAAASLRLPPEILQRIAALTPAPPPATDRHDDGTEHDLFQRG